MYFFYQSNSFIDTTGIGDNIPKAKNAEVISPRFKVNKAWRKFYEKTVGNNVIPKVTTRHDGLSSVDYFTGSPEKSLFQFIRDMNNVTDNFYADFLPSEITNSNIYGI